ncbi:MAG TPA: DUF5709 domain-containing protein [Trebonia sp.]
MPEPRHESQDLEDYTVDSATDTLSGDPGDEPIDRGVVPPGRPTAGMRYALKGEEESESLDELLSEQEPDVLAELDDDEDPDENATGADVSRFERDDDPDARSGRLAAGGEYDDGDEPDDGDGELTARDAGIDGGGASAEEAAIHVIDDPDGQ